MCNAWNHPPGCQCGWGGEYHGGGGSGGGGRRILSNWVVEPSAVDVALHSQPKRIREAKTCQTLCWWCGASVFYHTNGYGDCVLFDDLGSPWQVHSCWTDYWNGQKALRESSADNITVSDLVYRAEQYEQSGQTSTYKAFGNQPSKNQCREQRMAILAGAVSQSKFIPDEFTIAAFLGLTIEQLRSSYGDLYRINRSTNGIVLLYLS